MEWNGKGGFPERFLVRALAEGTRYWLAGTAFGSRDVVKQALKRRTERE